MHALGGRAGPRRGHEEEEESPSKALQPKLALDPYIQLFAMGNASEFFSSENSDSIYEAF